MGVLPQALKIIFQVQRKRNNEKIARRKLSFQIYKMCFFSLEPSYFQSLQLSYFLFILNDLKFYRNTTLSFTNHFGILVARKQHTKNFLDFQESALQHSVICYFEFLTPFILRGHKFLNSNPFFMISCVYEMCQQEGFQFCFNTRNNDVLPLDLTCPEHLSVCSPIVLPQTNHF